MTGPQQRSLLEAVERSPAAAAAHDRAAGATVVSSVASGEGRGVLFADVARRGNGIQRVRYFSR